MNNQTILGTPEENELYEWQVNADGKLVYVPKPFIIITIIR
jgi:hypothetical protein